jgi:hypothetical protein
MTQRPKRLLDQVRDALPTFANAWVLLYGVHIIHKIPSLDTSQGESCEG